MLLKEAREWLHDLRQVRTRDSFARNAMFAFSGTMVVVLSQLLLTPLVARVYSPGVYGIYGIFLQICMNVALVADLGYTTAYMLPRDEEKFLDLVRGNLLFLGSLMLVLVPVVLMKDLVFSFVPSWSGIGNWWYLLPIGVAVQFLPTLFTPWLMREKAFGRSSSLGGATNVVQRLFNLGYGYITKGAAHGLILGDLLVRSLAVGAYVHSLKPFGVFRAFRDFHWPRIRKVL
jgi:O-antigen/teichoic acid export membrane protein